MEREARDRLYQELRCNLPKNKRRRSTRSWEIQIYCWKIMYLVTKLMVEGC
jgi:hypothetical protein